MPKPKAIYLDSVAGVAGDMFTAAFVDAGVVTIEELNGLCEALGMSGIRIVAEQAIRATVAGTRITVHSGSDEWKQRFSGGHSHSHGQDKGDHHHHHEDE